MTAAIVSSSVAAVADASAQEEGEPPVVVQQPDEEGEPRAAVQPPSEEEIITVTASRLEETVLDSARSLTLVDKRDVLEQMPRTPAEALRRLPGLWVQKTGHIGGAPIIRGFMGNRVVYLFDGIRRNTAGIFGGPNSFLQTIDTLDVDRLEVVRGAGSVLYGSDAIGGVVNVISNEQPVFGDGIGYGGRVYARSASVDQEASGRVESWISSPRVFAFAGGTLREIDDLRGGRGLQSPSGWGEANWDAQLDVRIDERQRIGFFVQDFHRDDVTRFDRPDQVSTDDRTLVGLRYALIDWGFIDDLEAEIYAHDQEGETESPGRLSFDDAETVGGEVQATSVIDPSLTLVYGFHYHQDRIESGDTLRNVSDPRVDWRNPALFGLAKWQATERLRLDFGLRWDQFRLESTAPPFAQLESDIQDAINSGSFAPSDLELDQTDDAITGSIGAIFQATDAIAVTGNVGRAFRAPNKSDMLNFGQFTFGFDVPSGDLDPESSWSIETGVKAETSVFTGELIGYYTVLEDAVISVPGTFNGSDWIDADGDGVRDPDEDVFVTGNADDVIYLYGIDVAWNAFVPRDWTESVFANQALSVYGNVGFIRGENKADDQPWDRAFPLNGLIGLRLENSRRAEDRRWYAELELELVDEFDADRIPDDRRTRDVAFKEDPQDRNSPLLNGDGSLDGYAVLNLRTGIRISEDTWLSLALNNATDAAYRAKDSRIDAPGVGFVAGLDMRF